MRAARFPLYDGGIRKNTARKVKTPEKIAEQIGWDGYASIVDQRDIADIQREAWNEALETVAQKIKALSQGLDCPCDGCVTRRNDVATILEQRII